MVSDKVGGPTWSGSTVVINPCNCSDLRNRSFVLPLARGDKITTNNAPIARWITCRPQNLHVHERR
jgi:hypothetical protein